MKAEKILQSLRQKISSFEPTVTVEKIGRVVEVGDGIARISGLSDVASMEMLEFEAKGADPIQGVALNLEDSVIGAVIFGDFTEIKQGDTVRGTGRILSVPVGDGIVGRVVDPLGMPLDGKGKIQADTFYPVEKIAPRVIERQAVNTPMQTGLKAIDSMIPIGRGQRELIIGDRQTGKTAIALDAIINQKGQRMKCIYVAVGQKKSKVASIVRQLSESGAMAYTTVVFAGASDPAPMAYIAPYAGCAIGEYFMDRGEDVLVVYDDLSKHAVAYREISLLLKRPPGREAYPGDVFYLHSRLLERAARLSKENGGGSLTALPIIETQAGDISAYIPTNVISITDGQIFLESELFYQGIRPAVNVGLSVSRVGNKAQVASMKKIAGKLRLDHAQYRELAAFAQFASDLDESTKNRIRLGRRIEEVLKQRNGFPMSVGHQAAILYAASNGYLDSIEPEKVALWEEGFHSHLDRTAVPLLEKLAKDKFDEELSKQLVEAIENYHPDLE